MQDSTTAGTVRGAAKCRIQAEKQARDSAPLSQTSRSGGTGSFSPECFPGSVRAAGIARRWRDQKRLERCSFAACPLVTLYVDGIPSLSSAAPRSHPGRSPRTLNPVLIRAGQLFALAVAVPNAGSRLSDPVIGSFLFGPAWTTDDAQFA